MTASEKKLAVKDLKKRTEGTEMDLSLMGIVKVPVKEIAAVPKVTSLDLSCNRIVVLSEGFSNVLHYLVKLDLSKNLLNQLPEEFGKLQKLQHLDLYQNKLRGLPVSFCQLQSLRWLDLKDNPLEESFSKVVGDCLDDQQCKQCAVSVVTAMKVIASNQERERQKSLKAQRELKAAEKLEEERKAKLKKEQKKREKEQRRREWEAQQKPNLSSVETLHTEAVGERAKVVKTTNQDRVRKSNGKFGLCGLCVFLLVTLLAVAIGLYFYCNEMVSNEHCRILNSVTEEVLLSAKSYGESALAMTEDVFRIAAKKCNGVAAWVIKSVSGEASQ